jgi:dTDP-4-dehydrorhamnose 3,5-epimerase
VRFTDLTVQGAALIDIVPMSDERGFFARTWCARELREHGLLGDVSQMNVGYNPTPGTLRGLHYQRPPSEEVKIVRCTRGAVYDVVLDLRPDSPTFLRWSGAELTADTHRMVYVPRGCAHGYLTLAPETELMYSTSAAYDPGAATGVRYDDPAFGIEWPAPITLVSAADRGWPLYSLPSSLSSGT